jgi:NAD(P)-dependent dehydrogenase (short-subunit alcohol dehydrogenase family)
MNAINSSRIVAITGGAGALGSTLATHLARDGYRVALFDTDHAKERLDALAGRLGQERAFGFAGDLASTATWTRALDAASAAFGGPPTHAALIAGGWMGGTPVHAAKDADAAFEGMMKANVETAYRALRALLPAMVAAKSGSIVVVGSRGAVRPETSAGAAAYAASKAAVVAMAQAVAEEVKEHGVRINAILPSTMDTPANRAAMPKADPARWVSLESAAGVIAFLLSDAARDVSGAALPVYGRA